jgi:accessory gene regulator B
MSSTLVKLNVIHEESNDVYTYGFELIISALINILCMAIVSITLRRYFDWLIFLLAFIPLRTTAGGYHANSHTKCIVVGTIAFTVLLAISRLQLHWDVVILAISASSLLLILLISPVEAHNKKLKDEQRKKNRGTSIYLGILNLIIAGASYLVGGFLDTLKIYFLGVIAATLSMLAVKAKLFRKG